MTRSNNMEQRTVLAIVASLAVLFLYQSIFVPPKRPATLINSETINNKQVKEITSAILQESDKNDKPSTQDLIDLNITILKPLLFMHKFQIWAERSTI